MNRQVRKPEHIFDRARDWEGLVRFATADSAGVRLRIVSGRRRRGKTYLLDAVANTFGGFFFTATDSTETESLPSFGRALASYGGGRYAFADWDEALERLFGAVGEGLIIIDEFPYLMKASPSLSSLIQRALGPRGYAQQSSGRLLLSGSAMSVTGQLLVGSAAARAASLELIIRLERGNTVGAWHNSQATFLSQVVGPHFEAVCRDWALTAGAEVFGTVPGEVAAGVVADPLRRGQIQVDVAVFAPDEPGRARRVLSLGEAKWDKVVSPGHLERLRRPGTCSP